MKSLIEDRPIVPVWEVKHRSREPFVAVLIPVALWLAVVVWESIR